MLLITHDDVIVICTVKVDVAVAALAELAIGKKQNNAAAAIFRFDGPRADGKFVSILVPQERRFGETRFGGGNCAPRELRR